MGENITLGPGTLYIDGQEFRVNEGLSELPTLEAEDEQEAQDGQIVKSSWDAEITGEITAPLSVLGVAFIRAATVATGLQATWDKLTHMLGEINAAYKAAPPRVRHLALHARKPRTRKKNMRRIMREYVKEARRH